MCLYHKAKRLRKAQVPGYENVQAPVEGTDRTLVGIFKVALTRPWIILFDPISLLAAIYLSVIYCLLYMLFAIYPIIFQEKRGWNPGVGELPLIGTIIGAVIAGMYVFWDSYQKKKQALAGHKFVAEDRLPMAMIGGVLFPITMFWFAVSLMCKRVTRPETPRGNIWRHRLTLLPFALCSGLENTTASTG